MKSRSPKPRLVFFQYRYDENLPEFLLQHKRDHVNCLSEFFDVTVVHDDCDYQQVCDTYEPDLALFESGVNHTTCRRLTITNIRACPSVPKAALHNADSFCNARAGFLSDMDHWGIETFFAICTTTPEHTPEIAGNCFIWPNCVDPQTYRDYGAWKSVPVLFTGNTNSLYPWRKQIVRLVSERYPSLICPHPGYEPQPAAAQSVYGERYARMINASMIVPACGTVAKEVVRKHFEVPACKSCLVTERSAGLEAAGFVDMDNCVFVDEHDVLDKLRHLFQNPDVLERITERGHALAHARHTLKQRDQIYQWYSLSRNLQSDQRIVQDNPFGPLTIVDRSPGRTSRHVAGNGLHLRLLRQGDDLLRAGKFGDAERAYLTCMNYMRWMPEPKLGVALCKLHAGDARSALRWIGDQIEFVLGGYGAVDPDPVEWAYYLVTLLCLGKLDDAVRYAGEFPWLRHPELDRARRVVTVIHGTAQPAPPADSGRRPTIHRLSTRNWNEWLERVRAMLRACGQQAFADRLSYATESASTTDGRPNPAAVPGTSDVNEVFKRRFRKHTAGWAFRRRVARAVHALEAKVGRFLPHRLSHAKRDEFFGELAQAAAGRHLRSVLLLGAAENPAATEALLAGLSPGDEGPSIFCVDADTRRLRQMAKAFAGRVTCCAVESSSPAFEQDVEERVRTIKSESRIDAWDVVVVSGGIADDGVLLGGPLQLELQRARLVVFEGVNSTGVFEQHERLLADRNYILVAHNPQLRQGYAIFKRTTVAAVDAARRDAPLQRMPAAVS